MGKEWYWGGSKSKRGAERLDCISSNATATATSTSGCMSAVFQFFHFHHFQLPLNHHHPAAAAATSFNPINFSLPEDDASILKGVEAPRNSLELEEPQPPLTSSSSATLKEEENLNIPMGIQIKTRTSCSSSETITSSSSPGGAKTPNLVARLMGLDLLPNDHQTHSPSSSSSCHETPNFSSKYKPAQHGKLISHRHSVHVDSGTRSLPETPRISTARRSDVDHYRHRLSLQINKENVNNDNYSVAGGGEVDEFSRISYSRRKELKLDDESRSPSHYARQIVKQVKASVSRRVGHDITNTLTRNKGGSGAEHARERDEFVNQMKQVNNKRSSSRVFNKLAVVDHQSTSPGNHSTPSCSPRLSRFLEPKQKTPTSPTTNGDKISPQHQPRKCSCEARQAQANVIDQSQHIKVLPSSSLKSKLQPVLEQEQEQDRRQVLQHMFNEQRPTKKCKKAAETRLKKPPQTTDVIRNKQEETFVRNSAAMNRANSPDKKCKQTPLSNNLPKFSPKQVLAAQSSRQDSQLSSNTWQTYQQEALVALCNSCNNIKETTRPNNAAAATGEDADADANAKGDAEYEYVTRILNQTGINRDTHVSFTKWFSSSHPLDPCIFHHLENNTMINPPFGHHHQITHHCNRKLVFELVDEILAGILKQHIKMKPWAVGNSNIGRGNDHRNGMQGSELIDELCKQIRSYPRADCLVLEDIDGLIEKDLPPRMKLQKGIAFEEEGEGVVLGIEKDILDTLVHETAAEFRQTLRWQWQDQVIRVDTERCRIESEGRGRQEAEGSHG